MGIYTDIYCASCKKKTGILSRIKLIDGTYICKTCTKSVPPYMKRCFLSDYDFEDFQALQRYFNYSNMTLRPLFRETHKYYSIHIDVKSQVFYLGDRINDKTLFLRFAQLEEFELSYHPDQYKEGIFRDRVYGRILVKLKMETPYLYYEEKLDENVKSKAKKALYAANIEYENPREMDEFLWQFTTTWNASIEDQEPDDSNTEESLDRPKSNELSQAMALFMIDDLSAVTLSELKEQRNRLIKTFHPDKASTNDTKYAQKINSAYDILKRHVE